MASCVFRFVVSCLAVIGVAVGLPAMVASSADHAHAQSCRALQSQLASAQRGGGNAAQYRQYTDAAKRQKSELGRAERSYRNMGCRGSRIRRCASLGDTISQMRSNLTRLEHTRDRNRGRASSREIRQLERAVQQACRQGAEMRTASVLRDSGTRAEMNPVQRQVTRRAPSAPTFGAGYRTVCVRTCDGFFFPISFSTDRRNFERDQAVCAARCSAAPTMLFTHESRDDEGPQNMTALDGTAYTDLRTAFDFRDKKRDPSCTCGQANTQLIGVEGIMNPEAPDKAAQQAPKTVTPLPSFRPDLAADPETRMNASQQLTKPRIIDIARSVSVGQIYDVADNRRSVRVVGGEFLPDPEEAIDLTSPAPTPFR